ncbi:hypothetical protein F511_38707 [Dorcoceras hygrometricum]|uniref:Uncharacterized protein n=1 Tax=Dorcoceras hygrometricum TaxID=472368 RepID=A0A2Z7BU97_9LAMI|nr:hypothetical protein F511_38707 [Dorcoceras hygrometricum]
MAHQTSDDEVFDFSNVEFTGEDLVQALNDMVHEYKSLSHSFEEIKVKNTSLKNSSITSSSDELEDINSLKTELSKLMIENYLLRNESSELKAGVEKLTKEMSSWNQSARALHKQQEIQKSVYDRTGLGFSSSESSEGETSTQSQPAHDKFNKMSFVKANMIYDCYESITFDDQNSPKLNDNGKAGIGFSKPENSKPSWLKNKLDKDKAKAGRNPFVPNLSWCSSTKVKSGWKKVQQKRDLSGQNMKSKLNRSHNYAQTLKDTYIGKTVKVIQVWVPKGNPSSSRAQHIELSITDSACKNQLVVVSVQYGPFNPYIPIGSTTIGKSRVAIDPIAMHTSWRSNSDIASVTRVSMTFRIVRTNQYNQDLGLIHSTNGNHLEDSNEGSSIDHQVTIYLHAQNITMFPTNETWYFALQILVSNSGGFILILTAQSTRNMFRIHSDY